MTTPCTTPESATYSIDLVALSFMENVVGIDATCDSLLAMGTTALGAMITMPFIALLAVIVDRHTRP